MLIRAAELAIGVCGMGIVMVGVAAIAAVFTRPRDPLFCNDPADEYAEWTCDRPGCDVEAYRDGQCRGHFAEMVVALSELRDDLRQRERQAER